MKKFPLYTVNMVFIIVLFLLFPIYCLSQQRNQDDVNSQIAFSGQVFEKASQKPLSDVKISITNTETNKNVANTTSGRDGSYYFSTQVFSDIKISLSKSGYKKMEQNFAKAELKRYQYRIPAFYLDTVRRIIIEPPAPVRQSKADFIERKLAVINMVPVPSAFDLLQYLNPGLSFKDSLMSNEKIVLPKMPRVSSEIKRENKKEFQSDKSKDRTTQNRLRDSIDKLIRILDEDVMRYKIKYEDVNAETLRSLRENMRTDLIDYKKEISATSKLKAEGIIELLTPIAIIQERIISQRALRSVDYARLRMLWEDLSQLLVSSRFKLFGKGGYPVQQKENSGFIMAGYNCTVPHRATIDKEITTAGNADKEPAAEIKELNGDEVGFFAFVVWGPEITSQSNPDLGKPSNRYIIRYFKPAFAKDTSRYKSCKGYANVAVANLTRAKYGVEIYDTELKKYVEPVHRFVTTEEAFDSDYDVLVIPDHKEVKFIPITLK